MKRLPTIVVRSDILESWLTVSAHTRSQLANELEVSRSRISQLTSSHEEPSAHLIAKLMLLTNLPFDRLFKIVRTSAPPASPVNKVTSKRQQSAAVAAASRNRRPSRRGAVSS